MQFGQDTQLSLIGIKKRYIKVVNLRPNFCRVGQKAEEKIRGLPLELLTNFGDKLFQQ